MCLLNCYTTPLNIYTHTNGSQHPSLQPNYPDNDSSLPKTLTSLLQTPFPVDQAGHGLAEGQPAGFVPALVGKLLVLTVS